MSCKHYEQALIDAAASVVSLPAAGRDASTSASALSPELRSHLDMCTACRSTWEQQQVLFGAIDTAVRRQVNVETPPSLFVRLRAGVASHAAQRNSSAFKCARLSCAFAAAVIFVALYMARPVWEQRDLPPTASLSKQNGSHQFSSLSMDGHSTQVGLVPVRTRPYLAPKSGNNQPEVLVPAGESALLSQYLHALNQTNSSLTTVASVAREPELKPIDIQPVEISQLLVEPLSHESAE